MNPIQGTPHRLLPVGLLIAWLAAFVPDGVLPAPAESPAVVAPATGSLTKLRQDNIRVTFPTPMVGIEKLHRNGQACPIVFEPTIEVDWRWTSQTEGVIDFHPNWVKNNVAQAIISAASIYDIRHRARLRPGLRDAAGRPVAVASWQLEFAEEKFALKSVVFLNVDDDAVDDEEEEEPPLPEATPEKKPNSEPSPEPAVKEDEEAAPGAEDGVFGRDPAARLPARPRVRLEFSRDVAPHAVTQAVWFEERETQRRFPAYLFRRAAAPEVRLPFVQVNTGALEWKIARVSRENLPTVRERLREFGYVQRVDDGNEWDPIKRDPETNEFLYRPSEALIPALKLPVLAAGKFPGSRADAETPREVLWTPGDPTSGIYLPEVTGQDLRGRKVGNRALIIRSDWMVTRIEQAGGTVVRVRGMADGKPVVGVPVQFLKEEGLDGEAVMTNAHGEAALEGRSPSKRRCSARTICTNQALFSSACRERKPCSSLPSRVSRAVICPPSRPATSPTSSALL